MAEDNRAQRSIARRLRAGLPPRDRVIWPSACDWCNRPIHQHGRGRPRHYCRSACRQRAYERRRTLKALQPIQAERDRATWRLARLDDDLAHLLELAEQDVRRPLAVAIADVADCHRFAQRHGRGPLRARIAGSSPGRCGGGTAPP